MGQFTTMQHNGLHLHPITFALTLIAMENKARLDLPSCVWSWKTRENEYFHDVLFANKCSVIIQIETLACLSVIVFIAKWYKTHTPNVPQPCSHKFSLLPAGKQNSRVVSFLVCPGPLRCHASCPLWDLPSQAAAPAMQNTRRYSLTHTHTYTHT